MFNINEEIEKGEYLFPSTIEEIDKMSGNEFEFFLFYFFKKQRIKVRKTNSSNDKGIDLIITVNQNNVNEIIGIQAKRWSSSVNSQQIRNMLDGKEEYSCTMLWIITTSKLTHEASETAANNNIIIKGRETIIEMLETLKNNKNVKFKKIEKQIKTKNLDLDQKDVMKFQKLKELRIKMARELHMPIWSILSNETLVLLIEIKPKTIDELLTFKNLGHKKVDNYGQEILNILNS